MDWQEQKNLKQSMDAPRNPAPMGLAGQPVEGATTGRPSPAEQAEKDYYHHSEWAQKSAQAAEFFRAHPEFSEFIRLIRNGAIGI